MLVPGSGFQPSSSKKKPQKGGLAARGITGSRLKAFTYLGDTHRVRIGSGVGGLLLNTCKVNSLM